MAANQLLEKNSGAATSPARAEYTNAVWYTPRVDIVENDSELTLFADLPGVKLEDAHVHYENGELTLHAKCTPRHQGGNFLAQEYGVGDFYRAFSIGETIDTEKISAELKNGVLTVHLPKTEAVKPRRIAVKGQ
jgi:HSP20 family molecular chaperone IbpA